MSSGTQYIRLRRPEPEKVSPQPARHTGILQDKLRRASRRPWSPSFSFAFRVILLVRVAGAMYSTINDCDEVYNFWEPLHFLNKGYGFQTWEVSPQYAIRSWAYVLLHLLPARLTVFLIGQDKRIPFFTVRIFLALLSTLSEASFYRAVHEKINERVGRYLFFMLLSSAGMWTASTAFLPSSFAMYAVTMAFSYAIFPSSMANNRRTLAATLFFAIGGIVGWPFALALALPFIFEELFVFGADRVLPEQRVSWIISRWRRLFICGLLAGLIFVPVVAIDSLAYGKLSIVPWNIVRYNVFGGANRGPDLYGTSPWHFYISNLILNFNILLPFALGALPALIITYYIDRQRLGTYTPGIDQSSPYTLLTIRLVPFYLWFGIFTLQAHKEERFMFPVFPLLCFNAAVTVYLVRGWQEVIFIKITKSPYRASRSSLFRKFTLAVVVSAGILSLSRIVAMRKYYGAPMLLPYRLQYEELPRLLNVTGYLPEIPPGMHEEEVPQIDLSPIKEFNLRLCLGKEWHRFPSHYLIPNGVRVDFIKSEFDGLLPRHFDEGLWVTNKTNWWLRPQTRVVPSDLNDLNLEEPSRYVPVEQCDYLIDLDFPKHPRSSPLQPRYAVDEATWDRVVCKPFLDAQHSRLLTRILWMPGEVWQDQNEFDYSNSRLPPSSSELVALSALTPPSPILSPSHLLTSITSGDIPILLDGLDFSANHRDSTASSASARGASAWTSFYESHLSQSDSYASTGTPHPETANQKGQALPRMGLGEPSPSPSRYDDPHNAFTGGNASPKPTANASLAHHGSYDEKTRTRTISFLEKIKVVLSIDQESFRSVNPSFIFAGCFKRTFEDKRRRSENMARFVPVNQQTFHFHYAPFDGLPVLRRMFVSGDETRDYISREASLGLKSNGIYAVQGTEFAMRPIIDENRGRDAAELHWEFIYGVNDRRVGPSKKTVDGEKNLTPLSFSCSPALLHYSQGKRVNLLHIMKKSLTAKLTAEKLQSELATRNQAAPQPIPVKSPLQDTTYMVSNWHRRALSHGRQPEVATDSAIPVEQCTGIRGEGCHFDGPNLFHGARRRRASSAGEWKGHDSQPQVRRPPIQRHIVNPAKLAQMLEANGVERSVITRTVQPEFYPLAPCPRPCISRERNHAYKNERGS
nr:hypothetical protein AX15_000686 [Amanita polypyramis BW_CC]